MAFNGEEFYSTDTDRMSTIILTSEVFENSVRLIKTDKSPDLFVAINGLGFTA